MQKKINNLIILLGIIFLTYGCYPGGPEYYSDLDLAATDYSPEYWDNNNNPPSTYYMADSIEFIIDKDNPDNNDTILFNDNKVVLDQIEENMTAMNYTRLDTINEFNQPDLVLFSQVLVVKVTGGGYYNPWYPWWGGYYPYYPSYWYGYGYMPYYYSFSVGTVVIEMVDYETLDTENKTFDIVWIAAIDGLLRESSSTNQKVIKDQIDIAFDNSPYLNGN
jgi:Domain of unknown function (DUF4136)